MAKEILNISFCFILIEFVFGNIVLTENKIGEINGYYYELWNADNIGKVAMSINENNFTCSWKHIDSALFQFGKNFKPQKSIEELGNVVLKYEAQMNAEGYAYTGINGYGNTYELFFIVENYTDKYFPPGTSLGIISIDNGEYEMYYNERILPPNIYGISRQYEYYNVRKEKRNKGIINFNKHYKSWKQKGFGIQLISRISFIVEGFQSNGDAMMSQLSINFDNQN